MVVDATDWNTMPLNNAYGTVVTAADSRNVEMVFVAGGLKKWGSELVGWEKDAVRRTVERSRDEILDRAGADLDVVHQRFGLAKLHFGDGPERYHPRSG